MDMFTVLIVISTGFILSLWIGYIVYMIIKFLCNLF